MRAIVPAMRLLLLLSLLVLASPALARERCDLPESSGLHVKGGFHLGANYTDEEIEIFDMMALRQKGLKPRSAKRTEDGCIEAWVPDGQGGMETLTFDADTFQLKLD
jgi:hypothetical protein